MKKFELWFGWFAASVALAVWSGGTGGAATIASSARQSPGADGVGFSPQEWTIINALSPLPHLPVDTTNKYRDSAAAALLGQKLFFDPRLSGPIQHGTPAEGQLGAIGVNATIPCRNLHI